ncbi:MAG: hypothetical protein HKL95_04350 [Phycisphaerae bacterium]|nr:hypothetical protein [Phycisphaerae bacterium]
MAEEAFFVRSRGKISGPFDLAGLQRLVRLGMLSRVHELSTDKQNWTSAAQTPGVFPEAGGAAAGAEPQPAVAEEAPQGSYEVADIPPPPLPAPVAAGAATAQCLSCGGIFPAAQVYLDRGRNICASCFQKEAVAGSTATQGPPGDEGQRGYPGYGVASLVLGIGGLIIPSAGPLCLVLVGIASRGMVVVFWGVLVAGLACATLATIFASVALRGNRRVKSREGNGLATTGLVLGIISLSGYAAWFIYWVVVLIAAALKASHHLR